MHGEIKFNRRTREFAENQMEHITTGRQRRARGRINDGYSLSSVWNNKINNNFFSFFLSPLRTLGGLDLIIVPGLGFTADGKRLGRGKGYYDRSIAQYTTKYSPDNLKTIGLAFGQQICQDIPVGHQDKFVDVVVCP